MKQGTRGQYVQEKLARLRQQMEYLREMEAKLKAAPNEQLSLTDPDARSMATSGRGAGMVGYNVQAAVDTKHHLIVAHEVTNEGHDRHQLASMALKSKEATGHDQLDVLADRGYFNGPEILKYVEVGITPWVPKTMTSNNKAKGLYDKRDFVYLEQTNAYRCPAGENLIYRCFSQERGLKIAITSRHT